MDLEEDKEAQIKSTLNNDKAHLMPSRPIWSWLDVL